MLQIIADTLTITVPIPTAEAIREPTTQAVKTPAETPHSLKQEVQNRTETAVMLLSIRRRCRMLQETQHQCRVVNPIHLIQPTEAVHLHTTAAEIVIPQVSKVHRTHHVRRCQGILRVEGQIYLHLPYLLSLIQISLL